MIFRNTTSRTTRRIAIHSFLFGTLALVLVSGCAKKRDYSEDSPSSAAAPQGDGITNGAKTAAPTPQDYISSSAARVSNDSNRMFVRHGDLKFGVTDAIRSTYEIEDVTSHFGGFVASTKLNSAIDKRDVERVSSDSSIELTYFTVTNNMVLRVPDTRLDSVLKAIALRVDFLDFRIITADDVSLTILSNQLAQRRAGRAETELSASTDKNGKPSTKSTVQTSHPLEAQESADEAYIQNLMLRDEMKYSTIRLEMYQRQTVKRAMIANLDNIDKYKPGLFRRIGESLSFGWMIVEEIILALSKLWGFFAAALIAYLVYRWSKKRNIRDSE